MPDSSTLGGGRPGNAVGHSSWRLGLDLLRKNTIYIITAWINQAGVINYTVFIQTSIVPGEITSEGYLTSAQPIIGRGGPSEC